MNEKQSAFDGRACHGFRVFHENESAENLAAMAQAEDRMLRQGRILNGREPSHRNGYGRGFSRRQCVRWVCNSDRPLFGGAR